jgi:FAD-dependent urate hydroxylase
MADGQAPYTIAIIGAGVAGPVFALTILSNPDLRKRYKPVIYERLPQPTLGAVAPTESSSDTHINAMYAAGAAVALTSNALYPLYRLGLRDALDSVSCETERIRIWRAWDAGKHKYLQQINNPNWQEDLGTNLRVVERVDLQRLVLERASELGGEVVWGKRVSGLKSVDGSGVTVCFEDGGEVHADLVVGADGGWSAVRRHIISTAPVLKRKDGEPGRWKPAFAYADGIYGVSKPIDRSHTVEGEEAVKDGDTHWVLLDSGTASSWALPGGRQFWTISFPSDTPPDRTSGPAEPQKRNPAQLYGADLTLGGYDFEETRQILEKYENSFHPIAGSFGELYKKSEKIVRAPLWYQAWEAREIGLNNIVVIGDASRLMLPTSGQGKVVLVVYTTPLETG